MSQSPALDLELIVSLLKSRLNQDLLKTTKVGVSDLSGSYNGSRFYAQFFSDYAIVDLTHFDKVFIDALSQASGYPPCAMYKRNGSVIVELDKHPQLRYNALHKEGKEKLERLF